MKGAAAPAPAARSRWRNGIVALWCAFAMRLVFVGVFLPPWQNPDEPDHFAVIRALARQSSIDLTQRRDLAVQAELLASMAEHGWWAAYEEPVPDPLPRTFAEIPAHLGDASNAPPLYYVLASRYVRLVSAESLLAQYYALRLASLVISLLTFWLIMKGAREWFDEDVAFCTGALVALVPQFALIAIAASPDPLVFAASTFVWWQAARLFAGRGGLFTIATMVAATVIALFAKRIAVPLVVQASLLAILVSLTAARRRGVLALAAAGMLAVGAAVALAAGRLMARPSELATEPITGAGIVLAMARRYWDTVGWNHRFSLEYLVRFTWRLFESGYLVAGWMRFHAPTIVIALAFIVIGLALARGVHAGLTDGDRRFRLGAVFTALFVAVQFGAIYGTSYYDIGAQGRFLFPAIGPMAALCAVGLVRWRWSTARAAVCSVAMALLATLDLVSWVTTVIPAYVR